MQTRRTSGHKVAFRLLALIGVVAATAIGFWWNTREPSGPILAMAADSDHSVVLVRRGFEQRDYVHIVSRDLRQAAQRWSIALFTVQPGARPILTNGKAALRVRDASGHPETHVFDVAAGRFAFRAGAVEVVPDARLVAAEDAAGKHLVVAYADPIDRVFVMDVPAGRVVLEHDLPPGPSPVRVAIGASATFLEMPDGHVLRMPLDGGATSDLGEASVCVVAGHAYVVTPDGALNVLGASAASDVTAALGDVGEAPRVVACAGDAGRAMLVVTSTRGVGRTSMITVAGAVVAQGAVVPIRVSAGFGSARALPASSVYVVPFEGGFLGLVDGAGVERARYRVRNAREALRVRALKGMSVIGLGDRVLVFVGDRPHLLRVEAERGSGVLADVDRAGGTLFLAVEREVLSLDARTLALREHTGDLELLTEDVSSLLTRIDAR